MVDEPRVVAEPRREFVPSALMLLVAIAVLPAEPLAPAPSGPLRCARALSIDGILACDGEAPMTVAGLCGPAHPEGETPVHGGDAIDSGALCSAGRAAGITRMPPADLEALDQPADLNSADASELEGLPGIGPKLAARVIAARPFASVDALAEVRGIGPRTLDRLRPRLVARPINAQRP